MLLPTIRARKRFILANPKPKSRIQSASPYNPSASGVSEHGRTTQSTVRRAVQLTRYVSALPGFKEAAGRCRQASWFAQRAAEQDKERVVHQLQNSGAAAAGSAGTTGW